MSVGNGLTPHLRGNGVQFIFIEPDLRSLNVAVSTDENERRNCHRVISSRQPQVAINIDTETGICLFDKLSSHGIGVLRNSDQLRALFRQAVQIGNCQPASWTVCFEEHQQTRLTRTEL